MKITQEHYKALKAAVTPYIDANPWVKAPPAGGLSPMRLRWDILWVVQDRKEFDFVHILYPYLNDNNVDTALRHIFGHKE